MAIGNYAKRARLHAVIIPYPAQGHITPCLQLAKKLVALHGFRITMVYTDHIHDRFMKLRQSSAPEPHHKDIEFVTVSDGLPEDHPRLQDLTGFCHATLNMGPAFKELFVNLLKKSAIDCVIRDGIFPALHDVVKALDIPLAVFFTGSAISTQCNYHLNTFISAGILPLPLPPGASAPSMNAASLTLAPPQSDAEAAIRLAPLACLPGGSPTLRVQDIPTFLLAYDLDNFFVHYVLDHHNPPLANSDCILYNTFSDLEGDIMRAMKGDMNDNVFAVGPLVLESASDVDGVEEVAVAGVGSGLLEEDPVSLSWLDDQKPNSVLFVSFGSIATASMEQMCEFAAGLEASNVAFLWVIRPDLIADVSVNKEYQTMFTEFVRRTRNRALLVPWVPQTAVLSHPAVGAFLTHCGWNSVLESISSGVPMLGWPRFSDQNSNCHYITSVWKVGLELRQSQNAEGGTPVVTRLEVCEKVKKIMADSATDVDVAKIQSNCKSLQRAARKAVGNGGSSQVELAKFVELITSRTKGAPPCVNPSFSELIISY